MPVYAKRTTRDESRYVGRAITIMTPQVASSIPVPDHLVLCGGCDTQVVAGYLVYFGKRELKADTPYDVFCKGCLPKYFPKVQIVGI